MTEMWGPVITNSTTEEYEGTGVATALGEHVAFVQVTLRVDVAMSPIAVTVAVPFDMSQSAAHDSPGTVSQKPSPVFAGEKVAGAVAVPSWTFR